MKRRRQRRPSTQRAAAAAGPRGSSSRGKEDGIRGHSGTGKAVKVVRVGSSGQKGSLVMDERAGHVRGTGSV